MPTYEYLCEKCEYYFTNFLSISRMNEPEGEPCPSCSEKAVKKVMMTAPAIGDAVRLHVRRPDEGFKDVLRKIHDQTPGSKIKQNSSFI